MKLMQVIAGARHGGAETFFVALSLALHRAGIEQKVVMRPSELRGGQLRAGGIEPLELRFGGWFDWRTRRRLRAAAQAFRPDAVLTWMKRASIMMPQGDYVLCGRYGGFYNIKRYRNCDHLFCLTHALIDFAVEQGWPRERAHYLPNFATVQDDPPLDRAVFATPTDAPLLLALGRLHEKKGLDVLLHALTREASSYLWIAGEGPERDKLTRLTAELGLENRVRFLGWRADRSALYRTADICVFPTTLEGLGSVVLEAWAHGCPLISAAASGPAELIHDGEDALLVPPENADALAEAIAALLRAPERAKRLAAAGMERYKAEFTEEVCVARYIETIEKLIET